MTSILALNSGSSSLKFSLFEVHSGKWHQVTQGESSGLAQIDGPSIPSQQDSGGSAAVTVNHPSQVDALESIATLLKPYRIDAIGHRVVMGDHNYVNM